MERVGTSLVLSVYGNPVEGAMGGLTQDGLHPSAEQPS
jgi:hypothetical protein